MITNQDAFDFYQAATSNLPQTARKTERYNRAATKFLDEHIDTPTIEFKNLVLKFQRLVESSPKDKTSELKKETWQNIIFYTPPVTVPST